MTLIKSMVAVAALVALGCGGSKPAPTGGGAGNGGNGGGTRVAGESDKDGDGIPDGSDDCPEVKELVNGVDDEDGCPESDQDKDGLYGSADKCPSEPEDMDGDRDDDGCPDVDGDEDGVADSIDECPKEKETMNAYKDADGCPDTVPPPVEKFSGTIDGISFKSGSATIASKSYKVLREAAGVLKKFTEVRIEIQGHTDASGSRDKNLSLSQKRAEAVRSWLIKQGVDGDRMTARGYGPDKPRADNATKAGQAKNRRVDFVRVSDRPET